MMLLDHDELVRGLLARGCSRRKGVADKIADGIVVLDAMVRGGFVQLHRDTARGLFGQHPTGWPWVQKNCLDVHRQHYFYRANRYKLRPWLYGERSEERPQEPQKLVKREPDAPQIGFTFEEGCDIKATISLSPEAISVLENSSDPAAQAIAKQIVNGMLTTNYYAHDTGCRAYARGYSMQNLDRDIRAQVLRHEDGWQSVDIVDCHPEVLSAQCNYVLDRDEFAILCTVDGITADEAKEIRRGFYNGMGINSETMLWGKDRKGGTNGKRIKSRDVINRIKALQRALRKLTGKVPRTVHLKAVAHVLITSLTDGWIPRSEYQHELHVAKIVILANLPERRAIDAHLAFFASKGIKEIVYLSDGIDYKGPRFDADELSYIASEAAGIHLKVAYKDPQPEPARRPRIDPLKLRKSVIESHWSRAKNRRDWDEDRLYEPWEMDDMGRYAHVA